MRYDPTQPLLFIHIPKCAGRSLREALRQWFGDDLYLHYMRKKKMPEKHDLPPGSCVYGHFNWKRGFGVEQYYPDIRQRMTVLRDPLEMVMSNYFFAKRLRRDKHPTLEEAVKKSRCHMFWFLPQELTEENYREVLDDYFLFMGVVEKYDETIAGLASILGKEFQDIPRMNASPRDEQPSEEAIGEFRKRNSLAYSIYDYAKERLDKASA